VFRAAFTLLVLLTACGPIEPQWLLAESGVTAELLAIHGSSPDNVWAVGDNGVVLRFNGTRWERLETNLPTRFSGVFAAAPNDVWVVGEEGVILRWNGVAFSRMQRGTSSISAVFGAASNHLYFSVGGSTEFWNGSTFTACKFPEDGLVYNANSTSFSGSGRSVFGAGGGRVLEYHEAQATQLTFGTSGSWDVVVATTTPLWVFENDGRALRRESAGWTAVDFPNKDSLGITTRVSGGWASGSDDVWFFSGRGTLDRKSVV
jgi:hypothetical protein